MKTLSPKLNIALAIFFAVVGILHAVQLSRLLRSHKNGWDVVFHAAIAQRVAKALASSMFDALQRSSLLRQSETHFSQVLLPGDLEISLIEGF